MSEGIASDPVAPDTQQQQPPPSSRGARVLIGILIAVAVVIGGTMWMLSRGSGPARQIAEQLVRDLSAGNTDAALAKCTSEVDPDDVRRRVAEMRDWGGVQDVSMVGRARREPSGEQTIQLQGTIEFGRVRKYFSATAVQVGQETKIKSFSFD